MKKILRPKIYIPIILVIVVILFFVKAGSKKETFVFAEAKKTTVEQIVSITGNVKPNAYVDLAFEQTGRVRTVQIEVGDAVEIGQTLVVLENSSTQADLLEANAQVKAQQAKLDELQKGSLPEDIRVEEVRLENAKRSLMNEQNKAVDTIQDVYTKAENVVHNTIDQLFSNPRSNNPVFNHSSDVRLKSSIETDRLLAESLLRSWEAMSASTTAATVKTQFSSVKQNLAHIKGLLDKVAAAINALTTTTSLSQTTIDAYKADISAARTTINTAIANVTTADETIRSAEDQILLSESQLALKKTPTRPEQIRAQEASVEQAIARRDSIQSQLAKTVLRSPITGVVAAVDVKPGEIVSPNAKVISVISNAKFKIEAYVPEADITNLKVGNPAKVLLDAYEDHEFDAKVGGIDPAETLREGVPTYKVTLYFDGSDERIRSGLTANVDIITASKSAVLAIPARAVSEGSPKKKVVRVKNGDEIIEKTVVTGIRGSNGDLEIISGIKEGDLVVTSSVK